MLYHETFLEGHVFVKAIRPLHETQCSKQPDLLDCKEAQEVGRRHNSNGLLPEMALG